tara:strand:- start:5217 stop:5633 length:417 start_codon:yes stop_codon:yes gene_type:complete
MIRKLTKYDYNKNFNNLLSQLTESPIGTNEQFIEQFNNLNDSDIHLVIEMNNKIIAYGVLIIDFKFYRNFKNIGHIEDIIIDKNYRKQGLATQIISKLLEYGERANCYKYILNCQNEYINFYKKLDFKEKDITMIKYI